MVMKILLVKPACSGRSTDIALGSSESQDLRMHTRSMIFKVFLRGDPLLTTTQKFLGTSLCTGSFVSSLLSTNICMTWSSAFL